MFEELINMPNNVSIRPENNSSLFYSCLNQSEYSMIDHANLPYEEYPEVDFTDDPEI